MNRPLVSCLCITHERAAFLPWILWNIGRQTFPGWELVIVDSSREPADLRGDHRVRYLHVPDHPGVASKRNLALDLAQGEFVAWMDDDDWQHPQRIAWLLGGLQGGGSVAGPVRSMFLELASGRCRPYTARRGVVFNGALFRRDAVKDVRFDPKLARASDTPWMEAVLRRAPAFHADERILSAWISHAGNTSNPAKGRPWPEPAGTLARVVGGEAWAGTEAALEALRERCSRKAAVVAERPREALGGMAERPREVPGVVTAERSREVPVAAADDPPVSVAIKATILDVPWLGVVVPHMIRQARYPFQERVVVVDPRPEFSGKYASRPKASRAELDRVLDRLVAGGEIDRVVEVDSQPERFAAISARYFGEGAARYPDCALTGGPIYTTLFAMEAVATDHLVQMDADMLFFTDGSSWVRDALSAMRRDPRLWLMMTHPGPPAGPPGASLASLNRTHGRWDAELGIWRFNHATTRYFLCDRRVLRGRIPALRERGGWLPLERCLGAALVAAGASRGNLGLLRSWHLHAWAHGEPFPAWAEALGAAVADGRFPAAQAGDYDLRLDRPADRARWRQVLGLAETESGAVQAAVRAPGASLRFPVQAAVRTPGASVRSPVRPAVPALGGRYPGVLAPGLRAPGLRDPGLRAPGGQAQPRSSTLPSAPAVVERVPATRVGGAVAPVAVVIPIRDRGGARVRNCLASLAWQRPGRPVDVVVVSHGSTAAIDEDLAGLCREVGARLLTFGKPEEPWNKPRALNVGLRATRPDVANVAVLDVDMILAPEVLAEGLAVLSRAPASLVLCRILDLPRGVALPNAPDRILASFEKLRSLTGERPRSGTGALQLATRAFFFDIRGYDEDLEWWGAMDGDLVERARLSGLAIAWIDDRTSMLHQWHPRKHRVLGQVGQQRAALAAWTYNHRLQQERAAAGLIRRNPDGWGLAGA